MSKELPQRELARMWRVGEISGHLCIDVELAGVAKLEDGRRGELLGDRPDFIVGIQAGWKAAVKFAPPKGVVVNQLTILDRKNGCSRCLGSMKHGPDILVDALGRLVCNPDLGDRR